MTDVTPLGVVNWKALWGRIGERPEAVNIEDDAVDVTASLIAMTLGVEPLSTPQIAELSDVIVSWVELALSALGCYSNGESFIKHGNLAPLLLPVLSLPLSDGGE